MPLNDADKIASSVEFNQTALGSLEPHHEKTCFQDFRPGKTQPVCLAKELARVMELPI